MKRKNYYLIWCVLFIFLIMPLQFGCDEAEDELQQEQTAISDFDPWIYDFNCNGQIEENEIQAVLDDYKANKINKEEFIVFFNLCINLGNEQEENSEKSSFTPCSYDFNSNGEIDNAEISMAEYDWVMGTISNTAISLLEYWWATSAQLTCKFTVNWYGDQYLEDSERTSSGVQSDVISAVQNIVNQTYLLNKSVIPHWNDWDSHFTVMTQLPHNEINDLLEELKDEKPYGSKGYSVLGITYNRATDANGVGYCPGSYAMADCDPAGYLVNWPDITLYMHELCHNLGANHCSNNCVMNKVYAPIYGTTNICASCRFDINLHLTGH